MKSIKIKFFIILFFKTIVFINYVILIVYFIKNIILLHYLHYIKSNYYYF